MSLTKQLWLAIGLVMAIAFGGSMLVSVLSARHYLQQQLQVTMEQLLCRANAQPTVRAIA